MTADMGLGRKLELFLLDLLYPNACPCCGKSRPGRHTFVRPVRPNCWHIRQSLLFTVRKACP